CNFYKHLHALADVNHDGNVSAEELRLTLRNPAFRNRWSKLITHHHTEWQTTADAANWQAFRDRLSHDPEWLRHESERINNLVFWDEVAEKVGLPKDGWVSYFHPVEFVGAMVVSVKKWILGSTSERYESGGRGPGTVSTGRGDHGGVSYGTYQMSSAMGVVQKFILKSEFESEFIGMTAASDDFNRKWKTIAAREEDKFKSAQHKFIKETHYDVQLEVLRDNGVVMNHKRAAIHDLIWSTAVQFGPKTKLIIKALSGADLESISDFSFVKKVQNYKIEKNNLLFASSPSLWGGLVARAEEEKRQLIELCSLDFEISE
ncbi:hypothetical protein QN386_11800, partial [Pseudomonas sp. CCI3.2]|nr:hypothetical protein [Pseudomonas sp. MH10out]MEB0089982.1 hypothetical protein [Pseudomonas sp. CCI4.2]MEB0102000.1 hypothetical protein [Pseudomonas sp. CCI3.2]MEB0131957.1 hypothetical protein [Pseudomonas sp. CCI2.4]MEB0158406.1 hypothetical protein [Pseudomonas sp. AH2 (2023)]MEB0168283.1 hypothetical protein [Pseudomonas sp. CCC4.4]